MATLALNWNVKVVWDKLTELCPWFPVICDCYGVTEEQCHARKEQVTHSKCKSTSKLTKKSKTTGFLSVPDNLVWLCSQLLRTYIHTALLKGQLRLVSKYAKCFQKIIACDFVILICILKCDMFRRKMTMKGFGPLCFRRIQSQNIIFEYYINSVPWHLLYKTFDSGATTSRGSYFLERKLKFQVSSQSLIQIFERFYYYFVSSFVHFWFVEGKHRFGSCFTWTRIKI